MTRLIAVAAPIFAVASIVASPVAITYVSPVVAPRGVLTFKVKAPAHSICTAYIFRPGGKVVPTLGFEEVPTGRVTWRFQLPKVVTAGPWDVKVVCAANNATGTATRSFVVKRH